MSGIVLIFTFSLLAALLVWLLRRWPAPATALAGLVALSLGLLLWRWPNDSAVLFLGRVVVPAEPTLLFGQRLQMGPTAQWSIAFLAFSLALAYLGAWRISQGRTFFPFGLVMLALLSTVMLVEPLWRAPAMLAGVAAIAAFVVQAGRTGSTRGALRVMWWPVLAIPFFLLARWHLEQAPLDPDDLLPLQTAGQLASWGLLFLLAPWPLHGPSLSLGEDAPPLIAAWLLTALAVVSVTLLQSFLTRYEWLQSATLLMRYAALRLPTLLFWGGLALSLWAGLASAVQRNLSRQWSYAALFSLGPILVALGLGARSSWGLVWLLLLARSVGLMVSGFGLAVVRDRAAGYTDHDSVRGIGTRLPWASTALILGGLSLAGLPLTAGFAGQWTLVQTLGSQDWVPAVIVLAGALGVAVGLLRSQRVLLGRLDNLLLEREDFRIVILAGLGIAAIVVPALWPQVWREILSAAVEAFTAVSPAP